MYGAALTVFAVGCQKKEPPAQEAKKAAEKAPPKAASKPAEAEPAAAKSATPPSTQKRSLHKHMQEHFVKADNLKEAIIAGKIEDAQAIAKWMVEHDPPESLPKLYLPHAKRLKEAAQKVVDASGASEAAHGAAEMAGACADCHIERGSEIEFGADPLPKAGPDVVKTHMERHSWAVTRMWDGTVGGSGELYQSGVKVLDDLPMLAVALKDDKKLMSAAADKIVVQLKDSVQKAEAAQSAKSRAEVLGLVLSTCSNCHAMLDEGPGANP